MGSIGNSIQHLATGDLSGLAGDVGGLVGDIAEPMQNKFQAQGANPQQLAKAYEQAQAGITGQQQLAQSLAAQGGMANQANVFNQQQSLANVLQQQAMGQGPNPAQAALAQSTGNNIANQAALMAGQRGAGANAGMIARQASLQGGNLQQQQVGQAASMQAQQQLAAQQHLMAQQQAMQQVAGGQIANQMAGQGGFTNAALQGQQQLLGQQQSANQLNADVAKGNSAQKAGIFGGLLQGGGALLAANKGGVVDPHHMEMIKIYHPNYADGGQVQPTVWDKVKSAFQEDPKSKKPETHGLDQSKVAGFVKGGNFDKGGEVPAMVSPGEKYIPPQEAMEVAEGKKSISQAGEKIPGEAKVKGDDLKNDTVPAKLEEGGIVIPRSIMNSKDPVKEGTKFLVEALKKHGGKKEQGDFQEALKKAIAARGK